MNEDLNPLDWTAIHPQCDPIADLREWQWTIWLNRPLTQFEKMLIRAGLDPISFEL